MAPSPSSQTPLLKGGCSAVPSWSAVDSHEQLVEVPLNRPVTFAGGCFQTSPVKDSQLASAIANQPSPLKIAGSQRDALPMYPQHLREELLLDLELFGLHPVMGNQQPPRKPLLDG